MKNVIDSWKNKEVFLKQLNFNLNEILCTDNYPEHWKSFIVLLDNFKNKKILDIGCGCGTYYQICKKHFPHIEYTGIDYAEEAISLAKSVWNYDNFYVKNYTDLTPDYVRSFDLIHLGAVLDVLPNGDEALEFILNLSANNILIGRMKLTDKESYYEIYQAYGEIETCAYYHNKQKFIDIAKQYNYCIYNIEDNFYLKKHE
jgi:trans-aconitate methyltransferase